MAVLTETGREEERESFCTLLTRFNTRCPHARSHACRPATRTSRRPLDLITGACRPMAMSGGRRRRWESGAYEQERRRAREFEAFVAGAAGRLLHAATLLTGEPPGGNPRARSC